MALTYSKYDKTPIGEFIAPDFNLQATDGKNYSLASFQKVAGQDSRGLLVFFICNHCPYVIAVQERISAIARKYASLGIATIGINSNDPVKYPDDSFDKMRERAKEQGYVFPYAQDLTQEVARAYDAVCTPDPYLFLNRGGEFVLQYRGRIDDSWKDPSQVKVKDLENALDAMLSGKPLSPDQKPAMGCSIKWRT